MIKDEKANDNFSPYVGLIPFSEKDAAYFFGRDSDGEIVATNLRATALTVFYGASGVGKSSLLNARVIPYLKKIAVASILPDEPPEFILIVIREWANNPLESLRLRLKEEVTQTVKKIKILKQNHQSPETQTAQIANSDEAAAIEYLDLKDVEKLAEELKSNHDICDWLKEWAALTGTMFLIIFDQFEDIFLHPEFLTGENSFGEEFAKTLNCTNLPANFMISMRDDALAKMDVFKGKVPNMVKNILRLLHLDRKATEEAIRKPLTKYNEEFGTNFTIEKELVETLLNDLQVDKVKFETQGQADCALEKKGEDNTYRVETPYLQLVMKRLWENNLTQKNQKIELSTLNGTDAEQLGGVQNIVETHLDKVMDQFTEEEKQLAAKFIHFTVTRTGTKIPSDVNDLADWAELTEDKEMNVQNIKNILDKLYENRIYKKVNNRSDSENPYYEVSHDALGPAIISWRKRQNESRLKMEADFKMQAELDKAAREKEEQAKILLDEQNLRLMQETSLNLERKNRRLGRWIWIGGVTMILLFSSAAGYFYNAHKEKKKQDQDIKVNLANKRIENTFEDDLIKYKSLIDILIDLRSDDSERVNKARETLRTKAENDELPEEYLEKLSDESGNKNTANGQKAKNFTIVKSAKSGNQSQTTSNSVVIFIQFPNEEQRVSANQWKNFLKGNGYFAPNIEKVGDKSPQQNELRYFHKNDAEQAQNIIRFLNSKGLSVYAKLVPDYENSPLIKNNQFELWFSYNSIPNVPEAAK